MDNPRKRGALLALKVTGGLAWLLAYSKAIQETRNEGTLLLPRGAIATNLAWESLYTAGGVAKWQTLTVEDRVQTVLNGSWLVMDTAWIIEGRKRGHPLPLGLAAAATLYQAAWLLRYEPGDAARRSALLQNLVFSGYCAMVTTPGGSLKEKEFTAWRAVGTAIPTLTSGILRGYQPAYLLPGLGCIIFDFMRICRNRRAFSGL